MRFRLRAVRVNRGLFDTSTGMAKSYFPQLRSLFGIGMMAAIKMAMLFFGLWFFMIGAYLAGTSQLTPVTSIACGLASSLLIAAAWPTMNRDT